MTQRQAWVGFWLVALIWGSSYLFIRIGVKQLNPFELVFIRTVIAAIGLTAYVYLRGKRLPSDWVGLRDLLIIGVVNTVLPFALITWGEKHVESGLTAVLLGTNALFSLLVAHFAFADERITGRKLLGLSVGFVGVIVLASRSWAEGQGMDSDFIGQLAIIAASICYALGANYGRKAMRNLEPIVVAAGSMIVASVITGVITYAAPLFGGESPTLLVEMQPEVLQAVLILGVFNTLVAYLIFYSVLKALGAPRMSMITYIMPVVSIALGAIFLSEQIDARLLVGAAFILLGIAVVNLRLLDVFKRLIAPETPNEATSTVR